MPPSMCELHMQWWNVCLVLRPVCLSTVIWIWMAWVIYYGIPWLIMCHLHRSFSLQADEAWRINAEGKYWWVPMRNCLRKLNHSQDFCLYFFLFFIFKSIYLSLCWVFISVRRLSLVVASGGQSSSWCAGLSLSWPLLLRSTGSRRAG